MASDSSAQVVLAKRGNLSMDKKRKLVYEISKWSQGASEVLQAWSRQEILQILCAEMGKERKYTGLTKVKIIEHLLKVVSEKKAGESDSVTDLKPQSSAASGQRTIKRQRKTENPSRLSVPENSSPVNSSGSELVNTIFCKNSACRAALNREDAFCKRCSCCICHQFDDNKDPSLWLVCSTDFPFQGNSCGMSCHLDCAFKHESSGIGKEGRQRGLDGSFHCVTCGKVNDLLGSWRKQLVIAKDTRRVNILCYRVSLSHRLLKGTEKYQELHEIVDEAMKKLEAEVGPLTGLPNKMRGIVNRLSSGPEVQNLCAFAVESLDVIHSNAASHLVSKPEMQDLNLIAPDMIRFEDIYATSLSVILGSEDSTPENLVGYRLWHCKAQDMSYPAEPTCTLPPPKTKFIVTGLSPATEYCFKVASFDGLADFGMCEVRISTSSVGDEVHCSVTERSRSPATNYSGLSNPSSVEDETTNVTPYSDQVDNRTETYRNHCEDTENNISANLSNGAITNNSIGRGSTAADAISLLGEGHTIGTVRSISSSEVLKPECKNSPAGQIIEDSGNDNGSNSPVQTGMECLPFVSSSEACVPITPCKMEIVKDGSRRNERSNSSSKDLKLGSGKGGEPQDGSTSKKRSGERQDAKCLANGVAGRDFEYYVKVIRWLECDGHIEQNFRQKFLTWYSLRATPQEVRIVKVFVDTFIEDPASLAEQLIDTFSESISSKLSSVVPSGFCMKLWH